MTTPSGPLFVSHGAPTLAIEPRRGADLARLGATLPRPAAVVVVSAHWERAPATVGTLDPRPLLHDYGGFPAALREVRHDAPVAADLGRRIAGLLGTEPDANRPWDHGVWVPLVHLFPRADVPVVQVSLPTRGGTRAAFALGRALAEVAQDGVLLLGSGGLVHNLGALDWREQSGPPAWALDFEAFVDAALERRDVDALLDVAHREPSSAAAHPTLEHLLPLHVVLGAAEELGLVADSPITGFEYGSLSRRALRFAAPAAPAAG